MYFAAIVLPVDLNERVLKQKQYMQEHYGCAVGLKSPAHITIIPPLWMEEGRAERMVAGLDSVCSGWASFVIETTDFSAFKPRTVFIAVKGNERLNALKREVDDLCRKNVEWGVKPENRPFHPHITIATRDLRKSSFAESWAYFERKEFRESWLVEGVSVLKHDGRNWEVVHTSSLLSPGGGT